MKMQEVTIKLNKSEIRKLHSSFKGILSSIMPHQAWGKSDTKILKKLRNAAKKLEEKQRSPQ